MSNLPVSSLKIPGFNFKGSRKSKYLYRAMQEVFTGFSADSVQALTLKDRHPFCSIRPHCTDAW